MVISKEKKEWMALCFSDIFLRSKDQLVEPRRYKFFVLLENEKKRSTRLTLKEWFQRLQFSNVKHESVVLDRRIEL